MLSIDDFSSEVTSSTLGLNALGNFKHDCAFWSASAVLTHG